MNTIRAETQENILTTFSAEPLLLHSLHHCLMHLYDNLLKQTLFVMNENDVLCRLFPFAFC